LGGWYLSNSLYREKARAGQSPLSTAAREARLS